MILSSERSRRILWSSAREVCSQISEYGQITPRKPQTVLKVIKGDDAKRYGEASFKAEEDISTDHASITTRSSLLRRTASTSSRTRARRTRSGATKRRKLLMTEEHLEEVVAAEAATETATMVEAGEPIILLLKAELPAQKHKLSKPDSRGSSIPMGLITPTWTPRR